jgi:hypothetical protein
MERVLVEVFLPAAGSSYDIYIPLDSRMSEVLILVSKVIEDLSKGKYKITEETVLCDRASGIIFNINLSVAELGIKNGSKLMLI